MCWLYEKRLIIFFFFLPALPFHLIFICNLTTRSPHCFTPPGTDIERWGKSMHSTLFLIFFLTWNFMFKFFKLQSFISLIGKCECVRVCVYYPCPSLCCVCGFYCSGCCAPFESVLATWKNPLTILVSWRKPPHLLSLCEFRFSCSPLAFYATKKHLFTFPPP